jgi:hypothetical protein
MPPHRPRTTPSGHSLPSNLGKVLDFAPLNNTAESEWLLLTLTGDLFRFNANNLSCERVASCAPPSEPDHEPFGNKALTPHLHVSHCGQFAAVVNDYGVLGKIVDLKRDTVTQMLNGGTNFPETVPFSFAFIKDAGRTLCVQRTDWNRLDIVDPLTGELLSKREPTSYGQGEERPQHYLDYFYGALYVSPLGTHILSDGWVWHPVGVPSIWRLDDWCRSNVWESEDGATKLDICWRDYYWDHGMCWIDETHLAIEGIGDDDDGMIAGARIFDISQRDSADPQWPLQIQEIRGPAGQFFSDGRSLFSSNPSWLFRWNLHDGGQTGHIADFKPARHHVGCGELAQLAGNDLIRWRIED